MLNHCTRCVKLLNNGKQLRRKWASKGKFWGISGKKRTLQLRWCRPADCSKGIYQPLDVHNCQQWNAVYVRSLAVKMRATRDSDGISDVLSVLVVGEIPLCQAMQRLLRLKSMHSGDHSWQWHDTEYLLVNSEWPSQYCDVSNMQSWNR